MRLPHGTRLVFGKPLLHFFSMVSLVTLYGLVAVLIELLSSLIDHSHIFRLVTFMYTCHKSSNDSYIIHYTWAHIIIILTWSYLGTVSQLMAARTTVETHRLGSTMNRSVKGSSYAVK